MSRLDDPEKAKITFNIEAKSHQDVSQMISVLGQSGIFTNIRSGQVTSVERNKKPIFQAQVTCKLSPDAVQMFAQARSLSQDPKSQTQVEAAEVEQADEDSH